MGFCEAKDIHEEEADRERLGEFGGEIFQGKGGGGKELL